MNMKKRNQDPDGARLAVISRRLEGVAGKMTNTLLRTGRSGVLNRARDFSCCIVTANNELLAAAESLPIHVLCGPDMMARCMLEHHPDLRAGDAFLHNSPYHGCSHPADHTALVPVLDDRGVHRFTVLAKAHQADIGNSVPTTYHAAAKDVYEEGALIFPAVKVEQEYQPVNDIVRMCRMRIRLPEQWYGDYLAMIGAARIGERELLALGAEIGWDTLESYTRQWFDYSEQRMIRALRALPAGTAETKSAHDAFPGTPEQGIEVVSKVAVDPQAARVCVDLTDNPDCLPCGLNLSEACSRSAAYIGVFNSIDHTIPKNAGSFRRIDVKLRENCVVGIPVHPTSCSAATTNVADRVANSTQRAFAEIADGIGMAECGAVIPPSAGVVSGIDPRNGNAYVNQVFLGFSGGAAGPETDAWITVGHVGNAGMCYQDSVELVELYHPIRVRARHFIADSEGAGRSIGAPGVRVEFGPAGNDMEIGYVSDGAVNAPLGVRGGLSGCPSDQYVEHADGSASALPACAQEIISDGDTLISISCGGGGYGEPRRRDPDKVAENVRDGWITVGRAREIYKVAIDASGNVDINATEMLRADG